MYLASLVWKPSRTLTATPLQPLSVLKRKRRLLLIIELLALLLEFHVLPLFFPL